MTKYAYDDIFRLNRFNIFRQLLLIRGRNCVRMFKSNELGGVEMADKTLVCQDCKKEFVFTEGEQEFFKEKGFESEPKRCIECRRARRQQKSSNR